MHNFSAIEELLSDPGLGEQLRSCNVKLPVIYSLGISGYGGRGRQHQRGHVGKCLQHAASGE